MKIIAAWLFALSLSGLVAQEVEPKNLQRIVAIENVCAWPNLTLLPDGTIIAILFNQPGHGTMQGDVDCYASSDGVKWERRSTVTQHEPDTIRMNHAAGLAKNGDLLVLCSGWTDVKQPDRPKQAPFRDAVLPAWICRSTDGGKTWTQSKTFPEAEEGWGKYIPFGDIKIGEDGALHVSCYHGQRKETAKGMKFISMRSWHLRSDDDGTEFVIRLPKTIGPTDLQ